MIQTIFFLSLSITILGSISFPRSAQASQTQLQARCYAFLLPQNPDSKLETPTYVKQTWCYQSGPSDTYIFNADEPEVRPELSMVVNQNGVLTHGSLMAGEISFHRLHSNDYNPFPVPLSEPKNEKPVDQPESLDTKSALQVYQDLLNVQTPLSSFKTEVRTRQAISARATTIPWRGFWWAYRNQGLSRTENSPLGKYDRFLRARGLQAGSRTWENAYHRYQGISWEGHCNGWAASAILRAEPRVARYDSLSGTTFSVDDQKGLLSEMDYCANTSFYGNRYNGRPGDNIRDILPAQFHKTITYYIGELRKPVIMDYVAGSPVDNHPVSGYDMTMVRRNDSTIEVTARMIFHKYDSRTGENPGPAPAYIRTYRYTLNLSPSGQITGGSWISDNPDFIWVPLSPQDCDRNNPYLRLDLMQEILSL